MAGVGELSVAVTARTEKAQRNIRNFRGSLTSMTASIRRAATGMTGMVAAAAGLVGVASIGNKIKKSFANIDNLAKTADKLGTTTEELGALRFAAEENGIAMTSFDSALGGMEKRLGEAAMGFGAAKIALGTLGLNAEELIKLPMSEQLGRIADAMAKVGTHTEKAALSAALFGRSGGTDMLNMLRHGSPVLQQYIKDAEKLGLTVNRFDAAQIEKANDAFGRIGKSIEGLSNKIAIGLAPVVERLSKKFTDANTGWNLTSESITSGAEKGVAAINTMVDAVKSLFAQFHSLRLTTTEWALTIAQLGGDNAWAQELRKEIRRLQDQIEATQNGARRFKGGLGAMAMAAGPGMIKGGRDDFKKMKEAADKQKNAAEKQEQAAKSNASASAMVGNMKGVMDGLGTIGSTMVDGWIGGASGVLETALSSMIKENKAAPGILDANTAEGFAALRSSVNQTTTQDKLLAAQKEETTATEKVVDAIFELTKKISVPEIMGFTNS